MLTVLHDTAIGIVRARLIQGALAKRTVNLVRVLPEGFDASSFHLLPDRRIRSGYQARPGVHSAHDTI